MAEPGRKRPTQALNAPTLSPLATQIAARWAAASGELTLDQLAAELSDEPRYDIVAALKQLERAGAGVIKKASATRKAHFVWTARALSLGSAAAPKANSRKSQRRANQRPADRSGAEKAAAALEHTFHVRQGHAVTISLPSDVTQAEVARLCQFLHAIPFEAEAPESPKARNQRGATKKRLK